jgi:hypothetical protein
MTNKTPFFPLTKMKSLLEIPHVRRKSNLPAIGTTTRHAEKVSGELNAEDTYDQLTHIHVYTTHFIDPKSLSDIGYETLFKKSCDNDCQSLYTLNTRENKKV